MGSLYEYLDMRVRPNTFYVCESGSLKLRVFEYRVLWNVLVPEREQITGGWRKLRNERASYYVLHNIVRVSWPRVGASGHDHGNDPPVSIKCGEFLDWMRGIGFSKSIVLFRISLLVS